jgi:RNA polymerase sigma-70 factor (ECF subfamily)
MIGQVGKRNPLFPAGSNKTEESTISVAQKTAKVIPLPEKGNRGEHKEDLNVISDLNDTELVRRAKRDDQRAVEELIRRYRNKVYAITYQMCQGNEDDAQELTQESFFKAFKNIKKFKGKSAFYTWLYRITVNTCLDERKRRWRKEKVLFLRNPVKGDQTEVNPVSLTERLPDTDGTNDPLAVLSAKELNEQVQESLKALPEKQRLAFHLKVNQNMNIREIAQVMGSAEGTVKSHLFRAIKFMRGALSEWLQTDDR